MQGKLRMWGRWSYI
ncbi:DUF1133 family protein, partial [Shigella flexneri]|nr:DUF1133 family protein [Shigella flexneri]